MIPESIAQYRIIKKLGAGGMGEVYLALDTKLDRKVAIKVIRPDALTEEHPKEIGRASCRERWQIHWSRHVCSSDLGAGGMAEVYLAVDTKLDRKVAIKVIPPDALTEEHLK